MPPFQKFFQKFCENLDFSVSVRNGGAEQLIATPSTERTGGSIISAMIFPCRLRFNELLKIVFIFFVLFKRM